jgi:hypothetical protein
VAIWDQESRGTENMISTMTYLKKPVYVHPFTPAPSRVPF